MCGWTWRTSCGRSYRAAQGRWVDHRADEVDVGVAVDGGIGVVAVDVVRVIDVAVAVAVASPNPSATGQSIGPALITRLSK